VKKVNKYIKGEAITSLDQLYGLLSKNQYIFQGKRPKHHGWILSYQFRYICRQLELGNFYIAVENKEDKNAPNID
jgi:hypothetical protein